uniref:Uncharacterized protein n=1 Tax=Anguilla anguilla TaxID=7936 RepID=A0A0E9WVV8_ANGAN
MSTHLLFKFLICTSTMQNTKQSKMVLAGQLYHQHVEWKSLKVYRDFVLFF